MKGAIFFENWKSLDGLCTSGGTFGRVVKTAFNVSRHTFWDFFWRNITFRHLFWTLAKNIQRLQVKTAGFIKNDIFLHWGIPSEKFNCSKVTWSWLILCCRQKAFGSVFKSEFYVFGAMFSSKLWFPKNLHLFYQFGFQAENLVFCCSSFQLFETMSQKITFLAKNCQQLYPNCILPVQTKPLKKNLFCGNSKNFIIIEFWARFFLIIEARVFICIVDTAFYMSTERLEEICYFKHFFKIFSKLLGFGRKEVGFLAIFFLALLLELHFTCPGEYSRRDNFLDEYFSET